MRRTVPTELAFMAAVVSLAALSVFATLGSARAGDLTFCRLVDGEVVIGVTTDCSEAVEIELIDFQPLPAEIDICAQGTRVVVVSSGDNSTRAAAHGPTVVPTGCPVEDGSVPGAPPNMTSATDPSPPTPG